MNKWGKKGHNWHLMSKTQICTGWNLIKWALKCETAWSYPWFSVILNVMFAWVSSVLRGKREAPELVSVPAVPQLHAVFIWGRFQWHREVPEERGLDELRVRSFREIQSDKCHHTRTFLCSGAIMWTWTLHQFSKEAFNIPPAWSEVSESDWTSQHFTGSPRCRHGCRGAPSGQEDRLWSAWCFRWVTLLLGYCLISSSVGRCEQVLRHFSVKSNCCARAAPPAGHTHCSREMAQLAASLCCSFFNSILLSWTLVF